MTTAEKLVEINKLKTQLDALQVASEWDEAFLESIKIDFTYNSNKIEGSKLTYGQTLQLLLELVTPRNAEPSDLLDAVNHKKVLDIVFADYRAKELSEDRIRSLHAVLMQDADQWSDYALHSPGSYKLFENFTTRSNGKIHAYLHPDNVSEAMNKLISETNNKLKLTTPDRLETHPLTFATEFHQIFLNVIHPFSDGNGRIGRIFTNLILLKEGYPPVFIREVDKHEYLTRFEKSEPYAMLDFMADRLLESMQTKLGFMQGMIKSQFNNKEENKSAQEEKAKNKGKGPKRRL